MGQGRLTQYRAILKWRHREGAVVSQTLHVFRERETRGRKCRSACWERGHQRGLRLPRQRRRTSWRLALLLQNPVKTGHQRVSFQTPRTRGDTHAEANPPTSAPTHLPPPCADARRRLRAPTAKALLLGTECVRIHTPWPALRPTDATRAHLDLRRPRLPVDRIHKKLMSTFAATSVQCLRDRDLFRHPRCGSVERGEGEEILGPSWPLRSFCRARHRLRGTWTWS
jgi:hypothetical protein